MSIHIHTIEDTHGDVVDVIPFCSDYCHRQWCHEQGAEYGGWNGCHEEPDYDQECAGCGEVLPGLETLFASQDE